MPHSDIQLPKAENLSTEELRLQKVQQAIYDLYMAANQNETLKRQLEAATSPESFIDIAARQGYELTVADIEILRRRSQEQAQLNSDEFDDDELSEQELELVAGGTMSPGRYAMGFTGPRGPTPRHDFLGLSQNLPNFLMRTF